MSDDQASGEPVGSRACLPLAPGVGAFGGASLSAPVAHHSALAGRSLFTAKSAKERQGRALRAVCLLALLGVLGGCARTAPALKGGKASIPVGQMNRSQETGDRRQEPGAGLTAPAPATVTSQDLEQPENPAQPASQTRKETERMELPLPAGSRVTTGDRRQEAGGRTAPNSQRSTPPPSTSVELSAPSTLTVERTTESGQSIGAAQKDTSREITAKLASFKSVQWLGGLLLLGALGMFHPVVRAVTQSTTLQAVTGAAGLGLLFAPAVVVGNEQTFLFLGLGLPALWFFVHRHGQLRGLVDANRDGIDDRRQGEMTNDERRMMNPATR